MKFSKEINNRIKGVVSLRTCCLNFFLLLVSTASLADDIDLYISESITSTQTRPKVLIIFDTSGSMGNSEDTKPFYDPATEYPAIDGMTKLSEEYVYFSKGDTADNKPIPDSPNEKRRFLADINGCQAARDIFVTVGYYTGRVREYTFQGNSGSWETIPETTGEAIQVIDCEDDVLNLNNINYKRKSSSTSTTIVDLPSPQSGYPIDGEGTADNPQYHTTDVDDSNVSWSGQYVKLYTANYLRWQQSTTIDDVSKTRLEIAKESVTNLIYSTPNVDFGLQTFNYNSSSSTSGGRIVHGIQEQTTASTATMIDIIDDEITDYGWTPLCESLYESALYFGGKPITYGYLGGSLVPERDYGSDVETGSSYNSPFGSCSDRAYVVLITDGSPTYDDDADSLIFALPEDGQDSLGTDDNFLYLTEITTGRRGTTTTEYYSYLPALAGWMNNNDLNTALDGKQTAETYTIGFSEGADDAEVLLEKTAELGDGLYFTATDSDELTTALTNILANIEPSNDTLTSASVASNNFDRTQTLDYVYYAMFEPNTGPRWQGNIKKYKIVEDVQEGVNEVAAVDESTGYFSDDVQSYWSISVDGNEVEQGGVAEMLRSKSDRVVLSDIGINSALVELTYDDASSSDEFSSSTELATALDVDDDETEITNMLEWINGKDVDDEDEDGITDEIREDVFGDPLHSKPVTVNYGGDSIYLIVGTNYGVIHMFEDEGDSVDESWAFMPNEFLGNIKGLRNNYSTADKIYGVDGTFTTHIVDNNGNGIVDDADTVWAFVGYRRGGSSYYALDITDPSDPLVMWRIDGGSSGFEELGQTWSQPKVIYSKLNISGDTAKPALVFGGGYDESKDNNGVGGEDDIGRAIFMVDAETGNLLWSLSPEDGSGDTTYAGTDSIPSSIGTLDSDSDGFTDRIYAGDTGGNVWRIDMPSDDKDDFSVFKLASLGSETDESDDRRFFNEPSIVQTYITETIDSGEAADGGSNLIIEQQVAYDAILIGSGDRTDPLDTATQDVFFMIKDDNITTMQFTESSVPAIPTSPILIGDLYDYTDNPFEENLTEAEKETLSLAVSLKSGWFINLTETGEKTSAQATVLFNVVYYTTYVPPELGVSSESCDLPNGEGWLYAVDLALGTSVYSWSDDDSSDDDRKVLISEQFLDTPTIIITQTVNEDGSVELDGGLIVGREINEDVEFSPQTMRTYLYVEED